MQLYFLRHGLAGSKTDWSGNDDERPLTPEGGERMSARSRRHRPVGARARPHPDQPARPGQTNRGDRR